VDACWQAVPSHFPNVVLDEFVIMPNHVHGVVVITDCSSQPRWGRGEALAVNASPLQGTKPGSLAAIVQNFKSVSTRKINRIRGTPGLPLWQRNYYEHVIRSEDE
jgi:REP element-mobilizing transposase RayT